MTQPDPTGPPTWYNEPPDWVKQLNRPNNQPPVPPVRTGGYEAGRQDQELITAVRALPEQVVHALRSAIEAATPQQQAPPVQQAAQQNSTGQQAGQNSTGQQQAPAQQTTSEPVKTGDSPPNHGQTFADKWFGNKLFS